MATQTLASMMLPLSTLKDRIFSDLQKHDVHTLITEKLLTDTFTDEERYSLAPFVRIVGIPDAHMETYKVLWEGGSFEVNRTTLLSVIFHTPYGSEEFNKLTEVERIQMCDPWIRPMIACDGEGPFPRQALGALVASTRAELRPMLAARMETHRNKLNASKDIYQECWQHANFALPF